MNAEPALTMNVGRAIDEGAWSRFQKSVLALVFLALVIDGIANQSLSIAMPALMHDWSLPKSAFASVTAMGQAGLLFGALVGGALGDRLGRRAVLLASIGVFSLATVAISAVPNITGFGVLRLLDGFGIGAAIPTGAALVSEFSPSRSRSRAVAISLLSIPIGSLSGGLIGSVILPAFGWRAMFLINGIVGLVVGCLMIFMLPESPRYLARRPRRREQLKRILRRAGILVPADTRFTEPDVAVSRGRVSDLFIPSLRMSTAGIFGGFFFVFIAVYSTLGWVPALLAGHHFSLRITSLSLSAYSTGGIIGGLFAAKLMETRGSRFAVIVLACGSIAGAIVLSLLPLDAARPAPILLGLAGEGSMLNGLTTCLYAMAAHIFPTAIRTTGMGGASAMGRVGAVLSAYAAVSALQFGGSAFFLLAAAMITLGLLSLLVVVTQIQRIPARGLA
jgi:AAHS family 4-hydroxybenzoate transporter-like MFS transporter